MSAEAEPFDRLQLTGQVREALAGVMDIDQYAWDARGVLTLRGRLAGPAQGLYRTIRARLEALGFTPVLRRSGAYDELVATPGVIERQTPRRLLPVALFLLTMISTLLTGALAARTTGSSDLLSEVLAILSSPAALLRGAPFAGTVLGILFTHEMGHYIVGRLRGAPVSLPYFIPVPPGIGFTGTLGAVIVQSEPMEDRRTILEVGIAGPLAGLAVAIPLLIYGLATSTVGPPPSGAYLQEGNSLLYLAAKWLVFRQVLPSEGLDVQLSPVAWGAWIGLLVTMLNMLPIGQLDGGHVAYALLGERARYLAYAMIGVCVALGLLLPDNASWLVWAALGLLIGARHPAPLNDISPLRGWHVALAVFGLVVFGLLFMPSPLIEVSPVSALLR